MSLAFQRNERRRCSRCGLPLEDPASEERGYGPICARKDTHLYAKTIEANYPFAISIIWGMSPENLPEACLPKFNEIRDALLKHSNKAAMASEGGREFELTGEDLRKIIKGLDWILSFRMEEKDRALLVSAVKWLGYNALAAVLSLEASTSSAPLWFKDGFLYLKGASCKAGFLAMKAIPGIKVPARRGNGEPFSVPAAQAAPFLEAVQNFWPFYVVSDANGQPVEGGTIQQLAQEAAQWVESNPMAVPSFEELEAAEGADKKPVIIARTNGDWTAFVLPWLKNQNQAMYALIGEIKKIPVKQRKYNPATKEWTTHASHGEAIKRLLGELFTVKEMVNGRLS